MKEHISHILAIVMIISALSALWSFQYVSPAEWGGFFKAQLVGQTAHVEETPMNKLAQELRAKEEQLEEKEFELTQKEEYLLDEIKKEQEKRNIIIISAVGVVVLMLLMNFFLDWKRGTREENILRKILRRTNSNE